MAKRTEEPESGPATRLINAMSGGKGKGGGMSTKAIILLLLGMLGVGGTSSLGVNLLSPKTDPAVAEQLEKLASAQEAQAKAQTDQARAQSEANAEMRVMRFEFTSAVKGLADSWERRFAEQARAIDKVEALAEKARMVDELKRVADELKRRVEVVEQRLGK